VQTVPGRLIVISGPAASGKSTLARALQKRFGRRGELWMLFELDSFGRGLSPDWIAMGDHVGREAARGFTYGPSATGGIGLTIGADARRVLNAFHRAVAGAVVSGLDVICETIVYDEEDRADWSDAIAGIDVIWVRVSAPVDVLDERERADRTRLLKGLGRGMSARPRVGDVDVEGDSGTESVEQLVERVATLVERTTGAS
jgi:chloramphenicol 3-O-phosphotransferase